MIDYTAFNALLDESLDVLDDAGSLETLGFTKDQARFINLLITRAIEKHDELLLAKSK